MPAYTFDYEKPLPCSQSGTTGNQPIGPFGQNNVFEYKELKDNWGFRNEKIDTNGDGIEENTIDAWSLNKLQLPKEVQITRRRL